MTAPMRLGLYGTGRTAAELLSALPHTDLTLSSAVVHSPAKAGHDIGELCGRSAVGVPATADLDAALSPSEIDVLLYAGLSGRTHEEVMAMCAARGIDHVHACFVDARTALDCGLHDDIESAARASGSRLVGTGMIPGLWLDVLPALLVSALPAPVSVRGHRVSNIASWGRDVLRSEIGIGTARSGPSPRIDALLRESARLVADVLGLGDRELRSDGGLVPAEEDIHVADIAVPRGRVAGFEQSVVLVDDDQERLRLVWAGFADQERHEPDAAADVVLTLTGSDLTELTARVAVPVDPYPGTAARMLQAVRGLDRLPPGFHAPTALAVG